MGETAYFRNHEDSYYYSMACVWKNMSVPVLGEVMFIIDCFVKESPLGKSPWKIEKVCPSFVFFS